jgi:hypothetical protein
MCYVSIVGKAQKCKKKDRPLMIVARPLAVPIPRPLIAFGPTRLNLSNNSVWARIKECNKMMQVKGRTYIGAFCNMSGTMKKRIILPRIYT